MAASTNDSKGASLSKSEYLKRYLSADGDAKKSREKKAKKKCIKATGKGMKIVDDDVDWKQLTHEEKGNEEEEEEEEAPVVAEVIDERPDEIKRLEAFRTSNKWRVMGADEEVPEEEEEQRVRHDSPEPLLIKKTRHDSPEPLSLRKQRHDSPEPLSLRKQRHDSPDVSPPRRIGHESPDASLRRLKPSIPPPSSSQPPHRTHSRDSSPSRKKAKSLSSARVGQRSSGSDQSPPRRRAQNGPGSDSDQSPPRKRTQMGRASDSDQSPPRRRRKGGQNCDSDQSPPRRRPHGGRGSDSDLSPPRRPDQSQSRNMLSGAAAGLVSVDVLRREQQENRRREKINQPLEDASRNAETVFRDKSGKRRDIETEREEQRRMAGEKAEKDLKYAQWGKGVAQGQMQQQNVEDALRESQKPLARSCNDQDLDRMLREQEREGDPMLAMMRRKKDRDKKLRGVKEKPRYKGPAPPPNRFNIPPGYRWDGVDRSNGFEQKRYTRMADKKAVQEMAYKWSVEDM
ncbi:BUD13 homolog [Salmo salar]|uniref:BUD13 homolog n=1 Tax=Salmo salar TaxID=8030 RepID=A0ABM3CI84_SALSA|nr:BUD13 homolog [Salmo salar]|eukprot:XP_014038228.1 PREDICTED: BUD13 homolog [Salmo salar]